MKTNESYETFVMREMRRQRTPRTLHEAYQDGEYGYSIHLFKSDTSQAWTFFKESFAWFLVMCVYAGGLFALVKWLGVL